MAQLRGKNNTWPILNIPTMCPSSWVPILPIQPVLRFRSCVPTYIPRLLYILGPVSQFMAGVLRRILFLICLCKFSVGLGNVGALGISCPTKVFPLSSDISKSLI